jgi:hypothetical protein
MSDDMATVPIRELITSFRKQIEELPREALFNALFLTTITNRFEVMADLCVESRNYIAELHRDGKTAPEHMAIKALSLMSRLGENE